MPTTDLNWEKLLGQLKRGNLVEQGLLAAYENVLVKVITRLSAEDKAELNRAIKSHPENAGLVFNYIETKVPGLRQIIKREIEWLAKDTAHL